ncbi:phage portal protein [Clostridium sp.]|uniref:phage portal protein n=1 Tax=Clostridium sp. TaxID=1506 RepID=UPI003993668C
MGILKKIKSFFNKGGDNNMNSNNYLTEATLLALYDEFVMSEKFQWMDIGERYYRNKTDIAKRVKYKVENGQYVVDETMPNNKLNFNYTKLIVDQKVNYCLSKAPQFSCEDEQYLKAFEGMLKENKFDYYLPLLGTQTSNNGIGWLQPYIDEDGNFKFILVPAKQCIALWEDDLHMQLRAMIRVYQSLESFNVNNPQPITILEYWTSTGMQKFKVDGTNLVQLNNFDLLTTVDGKLTGESAHYKAGDWLKSWGKVPFIPFKNNMFETPDIQDFKTLIDDIERNKSDVSNGLEELRNRIIILENAGGTEIEEFLSNLRLYGIAKTNNVDGSGSKVDVLNTPLNCEGAMEHTTSVKTALMEIAQAANTSQEWKVPPAGVTLELLYRGLDIKCNGFEAQFRFGINELQYFFKKYLEDKGQTVSEIATVEFIRDTPQNVNEQIQNIKDSVDSGSLSKETAIKKNPLVDDPEEEYKKIQSENKEYNFDSVPFKSFK